MFPNKIIEVQKKLKKKEKGTVGNTYTCYFLFCHTGVLFFCYFAFMQKFRYVFFVKRAQPE
jgi:hypothetical protein